MINCLNNDSCEKPTQECNLGCELYNRTCADCIHLNEKIPMNICNINGGLIDWDAMPCNEFEVG